MLGSGSDGSDAAATGLRADLSEATALSWEYKADYVDPSTTNSGGAGSDLRALYCGGAADGSDGAHACLAGLVSCIHGSGAGEEGGAAQAGGVAITSQQRALRRRRRGETTPDL